MAAMRRAGEVKGGGWCLGPVRVPEVSSTILISFIDNSGVSSPSLVNVCFLFPPELRIEGAALARMKRMACSCFFFFFFRRRRRRRVSFLLPFSFEEMIKELSGEEKKLNEIIMWNLIFFFLFNLKYSTRNLFIMMLNVERILLKFWEAKRGERGSRGGFPRMYGYVSRFLVDVSCGLVRSFFDGPAISRGGRTRCH